jgi:beta-mannosidase
MRVSLNGGWWMKDFVGEDWLWRNAHKPDSRESRGWRTGRVPGSVQDDLWRDGEIANPYIERNTLLAEWASERTWLYKRTFVVDISLHGQRAQLRFEGVDYAARFYLNGEFLGSHASMFTPVTFEVGDRLLYGESNLIAVVLDPAPPEQPQVGYSDRVRTGKTRMNYWWDFCPRLVHLGIWRDVALEFTGPVRLEDVFVRSRLEGDLGRAEVNVTTTLSSESDIGVKLRCVVRFVGEVIAEVTVSRNIAAGTTVWETSLAVDRPHLWWPNGAGEQPLYEAKVTAASDSGHAGPLSPGSSTAVPAASPANPPGWSFPPGDPRNGDPGPPEVLYISATEVDSRGEQSRTAMFGIRSIELASNDTPDSTARPYTFVVNGQPLYITGWNWVPVDVLYGVPRPEKLERLLSLARRAHVNLLRVWGGGLIESDAFYDLCDRFGIMVWQEFIQSASGIDNNPPSDPEFIAEFAQEAERIIPLRRNHPSLALWCGGNELQRSPEQPCDGSEPLLAALAQAVARHDPGRAWLPTSPTGRFFGNSVENIESDPDGLHDVHGPWHHSGLAGQFELYNRGTSLLHSEFGVEGATNLKTIEACVGEAHRWPPALENRAWWHTGAWWLREHFLQEVLGTYPPDLRSFVQITQYLQASGLQYALEADRRRWPRNSGTLPWQFNEPFPNLFCTPAVDYFAEPKPVYYSVARAYAPLTITASFSKQALAHGNALDAVAWIDLNASDSGVTLLQVQAFLLDATLLDVEASPCTGESSRGKPCLAVRVPLHHVGGLFLLDLVAVREDGTRAATNRYLFSAGSDLHPLLDLPRTTLAASVERRDQGWTVELHNVGEHTAIGVWVEDARPREWERVGWAYFDDNYFHLLPREQVRVQVEWSGVPEAERRLQVSSLNAGTVQLA